ncbi:MAG: hypothetical protein ACI4JK_03425 [Oscillospiraceae bacterium]
MDLRCYHVDADGDRLILDGICEEWFAVLWNRRFAKGDDFTIELPPTVRNIALFSEGKVIELMKPHPLTGDSEHVGVITAVSINAGERSVLTISGQSFDGMLERRILVEHDFKTTAMTVLRKNCGDLANVLRRFYALDFDTSTDIEDDEVFPYKFKTLADYAGHLAASKGWGLRSSISHGSAIRGLISGYNAVDRSIHQSDVKRVIFSDDFENASSFERSHNESGAVTGVVIGSNAQRNVTTHVDIAEFISYYGDTSGYDRIEKFQQITPVTVQEVIDGEIWNVIDEWETQLKANELAKPLFVPTTDFFGADIAIRGEWETKFSVGDIVTVHCKDWNMSADKQISEIKEFWDADNVTVTATLGDPSKTLMEVFKKG